MHAGDSESQGIAGEKKQMSSQKKTLNPMNPIPNVYNPKPDPYNAWPLHACLQWLALPDRRMRRGSPCASTKTTCIVLEVLYYRTRRKTIRSRRPSSTIIILLRMIIISYYASIGQVVDSRSALFRACCASLPVQSPGKVVHDRGPFLNLLSAGGEPPISFQLEASLPSFV